MTEREPATVSPAGLVEVASSARPAFVGSAGRCCCAGSAGRRPAEPRRPRPAQPHRHDRRGAVRCHRRPGRPACADRSSTLPDAAAGDADHRAGFPRFGLYDEGGVPADHRYWHCRSAGRQLAEPEGLLRALLFRHRSAVHRGVVEPGEVSVQVQLDRDGQRRQATHTVRRQHRGAVHGISGADGDLPVPVDGAGEDLHRGDEAGVGADHRRGRDVFQHRGVRIGAGVADHRVGQRAACGSTTRLGRGAGGGVADPDLSGLHEFRRTGNGFRDRGAAGMGAAKAVAGRCD